MGDVARRLGWGPAGVVVAAVLLGLIGVVPIVELVATAAGEGTTALRATFARPGSVRAAFNTVWTAVAVTPLAVAGGLAAALVTERTAAPGRRALRVAVLLTLLVPPFVSAESWARAYGPSGLIDDLLGVALPGLIGPVGVVAVIAAHALPLAYLVVAGALTSRAEPDLERAARVAGASRWVAFRTVTLPLLRPALVAAAALVFVTAVNAFGIPAVLGLPAGFVTLTTRIYRDLAFAADPAAFTRVVVLSTTLVALALATVGTADAAIGVRGPVTRTGAPAGGAVPA
ncbi:MAG: ABC transporter permease subunit, partial [Actinomycetota bacterium]|nr:ABC transporter permease subunit [Actinomycetota bacterium]